MSGASEAETLAMFALMVAAEVGETCSGGGDPWIPDASDVDRAREATAGRLAKGRVSQREMDALLPLARRLVAAVRSEALADGVDIARTRVDLDQGSGYGAGGASNDWRDVESTLRAAQDGGGYGHCARRTPRPYDDREPLADGLCATCIAWGEDSHRYERKVSDAE